MRAWTSAVRASFLASCSASHSLGHDPVGGTPDRTGLSGLNPVVPALYSGGGLCGAGNASCSGLKVGPLMRQPVTPPPATFLKDVMGHDGQIATDLFIRELRINKTELAMALGLSRDSVSKVSRLKSPATQARLRDVAEILNRVLPWTGSAPQAFAWYRAQSMPSFGDRTAEDLVKEGRAEAVKAHLSRIAVGGCA